jgi:hypothetical protein
MRSRPPRCGGGDTPTIRMLLCGAVVQPGLAHWPVKPEIAGSNPVGPATPAFPAPERASGRAGDPAKSQATPRLPDQHHGLLKHHGTGLEVPPVEPGSHIGSGSPIHPKVFAPTHSPMQGRRHDSPRHVVQGQLRTA